MKLVSEFLHEFHKRYPRIQVTLAVRTPQQLAEGLECGLFDLCGGLELTRDNSFRAEADLLNAHGRDLSGL